MVSYDIAEYIVNDMKQNLAGLARAIADALKDGKVTPLEGIMLGAKAMQLGTAVITAMQSVDTGEMDNILAVLEYGSFVAPPVLQQPIPPEGSPPGLGAILK